MGKKNKKIFVVRNSNYIKYLKIEDISKIDSQSCIIGYFGVINDDYASGFCNIVELALYLMKKSFVFRFDIIGDGPGLKPLKALVNKNNLDKFFCFYGYVELNESFEIIKNFDFGLVPWPNIEKNNVHTAMKIMDYMCCGVPVCSLNLKEQVYSTKGIGIHTDDFEMMANEIIRYYNDKILYHNLRKETLEHFNKNLAWEYQIKQLLQCYDEL